LPATGLLFPLALRANQADSKSLVRTILAVDEGEQSLTFAGDIPEGAFAQLMKANFDRLVQGASEAASSTRLPADIDSSTLAIAISCVGRRLVLGERTEEETEATLDVLPKGTQQVGFYSYGEISPYTTGTCDLHNQTMTLTTLSEAA
ncbi:MAG: FIST C-terminal domain-containing protein, partial [Nitrospira sp.]|nr:FIST C-terminal domain-containing protein [Nitrospira sp.]